MKKYFFAGALVLGMTITAVNAQTVGPLTTTTPVPMTLTDWSNTLQFQQFDPSLGTLLSVEIDLSGSFQTVLTITNNSDSASSGIAKTEVQMSVTDPSTIVSAGAPQLDILSNAFSYSLGAGGSVSSGTLTKNGTYSNTFTAPAVLSEFTGLGFTSLGASTFTQTEVSNTGGNTGAAQITSAALTGDVIYNYEPIPEPPTFALAGLGGLGLLALRRRVKR